MSLPRASSASLNEGTGEQVNNSNSGSVRSEKESDREEELDYDKSELQTGDFENPEVRLYVKIIHLRALMFHISPRPC